MKKFTQKLSVFLLTLVNIFTIGHKKVKAQNSPNINNGTLITDENYSNNEDSEQYVLDEGKEEEENLEKRIKVTENYYKSANVSRDCILLLNYPYLKSLGYIFPSYINTGDLRAIFSLKNTEFGWNTINLRFATDPDKSANIEIDPDNWRELEKMYLMNFNEELKSTQVLKYSNLLLDNTERKEAEEVEELCYKIYQEYYDSNGNTNSIKLNALLLRIKEKIQNDNLFINKSNGFYIVMSEILDEFRTIFTMVDIKYVEIGSIAASKANECKNNFINQITFIIINSNMYDEDWGLYSNHPYSRKYLESENKWYGLLSPYTRNLANLSKIEKPIIDLMRIKRYFTNKVSTIMKSTGNYNIDIEKITGNFFQTLNYEYMRDNGLVYDDNYDFNSMYDTLASIYRLNSRTLKNKYNPDSINYTNKYINNSYTSLIVPYSDLILDKKEYIKSKEIEDIYLNIINNYISNIRIAYTNEPFASNNVSVMDINFYSEVEEELDNIIQKLEELKSQKIQNH